MEITPKLSIIIPMYNSFSYLQKNIAVIENDPLSEYTELVVVDDCSTDDSFQNMLLYSQESNLAIRVFQNMRNSGPGVARNRGIENATGQYITFVDSDDYLAKDSLKIILDAMSHEYDIIIFDYTMVDETGKEITAGRSIGTSSIQPGMVNSKDAFVYTFGSTWGKVYNRDLIEHFNIRFGDMFRSEDMPFTKQALALSETICYLPNQLYNYVQRSTSLMHTTTLSNEKNSQKAFSLLKQSLAGQNFAEELYAIELREVLNDSVLIKINRGDPHQSICSYIKENYSSRYFKNKYFRRYPLHVKITSYLAYSRCIVLLKIVGKYRMWIKKKQL